MSIIDVGGETDGRRRCDRRHGPAGAAERAEPTYASEKLSYALFKAAEGLALCDVELAEVTDEARRGHDHGRWVKEDAQ